MRYLNARVLKRMLYPNKQRQIIRPASDFFNQISLYLPIMVTSAPNHFSEILAVVPSAAIASNVF